VFDWLIVGAGFAGATLAERLATQRGDRVLVIDKRPHIGGNAYDRYNEDGVLVHPYGPHIFHTNSAMVFKHLSQFTDWRPYAHRVLGRIDDKLVPIPINLDTINTLYDLDLAPDELEGWLASRAEKPAEIRSAADVVVSAVGRELYEKLFRGYTRKQWGMDPSDLDKSVTTGVPVRSNRDDRYFADEYQYMPKYGYTRMFEKMLRHPNIKVMTQTDFREVRDEIAYKRLVFTGPIDEYFDFRYGKLPYRSVKFRHETLDQEFLLPTGTITYPQTEEYTRVSEYKHMTGQVHPKTTVTYEYPSAAGDPCYPIPTADNAALFKQYERLAANTPNVWFVGRLATYRYYSMDQVTAQALATFRRIQDAVPIGADAGIEPPAVRIVAAE